MYWTMKKLKARSVLRTILCFGLGEGPQNWGSRGDPGSGNYMYKTPGAGVLGFTEIHAGEQLEMRLLNLSWIQARAKKGFSAGE